MYHIDESISVIRKVSVQFISECPMSPFHAWAFIVRVPTHMELNAFALQHVLKRPVQKFFSPFRLHPAYRLRLFWVFKNRLKR